MRFESNIPGAPIPVHVQAAHAPSTPPAGMLQYTNLFGNISLARSSYQYGFRVESACKNIIFLVQSCFVQVASLEGSVHLLRSILVRRYLRAQRRLGFFGTHEQHLPERTMTCTRISIQSPTVLNGNLWLVCSGSGSRAIYLPNLVVCPTSLSKS